MTPRAADHAVVVVGAGAVGLSAAIAIAQQGFAVSLVGRPSRPQPGRTVALLQGSIALLRGLGLWDRLAEQAAPLRTMRIVDATGSLFRAPPVAFRAAEIGLEAFGANIDNTGLEQELRAAAADTAGLTLLSDAATDVRFTSGDAVVSTEAGQTLHAGLVVAADGRGSRTRKAAHIGVRTVAHRQSAITAFFAHEAPHEGVSTEFHTRQGPFTLVPLPPGPAGEHRSSLVWVMSPAEAERRRQLRPEALAAEAERQCRRLLGAMRVEGAIGVFPITTSIAARLVAPRLVLIGEAAHALPPIGAQGLNLSFRDVAALAAHLSAVRARGDDMGAAEGLEAYARSRAGDVATRSLGVGLLNRSLLTRNPVADLARGFGLVALGQAGPLRRFAMRHGLAPEAPPRLARP